MHSRQTLLLWQQDVLSVGGQTPRPGSPGYHLVTGMPAPSNRKAGQRLATFHPDPLYTAPSPHLQGDRHSTTSHSSTPHRKGEGRRGKVGVMKHVSCVRGSVTWERAHSLLLARLGVVVRVLVRVLVGYHGGHAPPHSHMR